MNDYELLIGDCRETLRQLEPNSVHCVVTSPPFFNLRNYGDEGQIGLEETPMDFVANMVQVGEEIWRVLRDDGTFWLNLGDSYAGGGGSSGHTKDTTNGTRTTESYGAVATGNRTYEGIKKKDLIGIPWMVAFALREAGWYLRQSIVWAKPNPMPESVTDRCTRSHEMIFMFSKQPKYYYDQQAIKEPIGESMIRHIENGPRKTEGYKHDSDTRMGKASGNHLFSRKGSLDRIAAGRNKRDVWMVSPKAFKGAHFAVYPPDLIEPCIIAGCPPGGVVLDPFGGSGTTAGVAIKHGRKAILCELNAEYAELIPDRIRSIAEIATVENDAEWL